MDDADRFKKQFQQLLDSLKAVAVENAKHRPEIETAEDELRKRMAEVRRLAFPRHLEACGAGPSVVEPYRRGLAPTPALDATRAFLEGSKPFCVLLGSNGIGKSVAAAYALRLATRWTWATPNHPRAEPIQVEDLDSQEGMFLPAHELRHSSRFSDGPAYSTLERAGRVKVLVVDELRAVDFKGVGLERLEEVLSERYTRGLRTVITANLTRAEVIGQFSPLLRSRFDGGADLFEASGADMRRPA